MTLTNAIKLSNADYTKFVSLIYNSCGINLGSNKQELLKTRFIKVMRRLGIDSFKDYYSYVTNDADGTAFSEMIDAISTNHTYFFREKDHFTLLSKSLLPEIIRRKRVARSNRIRIWCAASSSGEEPYSIAISVLETMDTANWDIKLLATDISSTVLKKASAGIYKKNQFRETSPLIVDKYFTRQDSDNEKLYRVKDKVRQMISFRMFNLMTEQFPFKGKFDIIFCRNVMIYFDEKTQTSLTERMLRHLEPCGFFFIGHSETVSSALRQKLRPLAPAAFEKI